MRKPKRQSMASSKAPPNTIRIAASRHFTGLPPQAETLSITSSEIS